MPKTQFAGATAVEADQAGSVVRRGYLTQRLPGRLQDRLRSIHQRPCPDFSRLSIRAPRTSRYPRNSLDHEHRQFAEERAARSLLMALRATDALNACAACWRAGTVARCMHCLVGSSLEGTANAQRLDPRRTLGGCIASVPHRGGSQQLARVTRDRRTPFACVRERRWWLCVRACYHRRLSTSAYGANGGKRQ